MSHEPKPPEAVIEAIRQRGQTERARVGWKGIGGIIAAVAVLCTGAGVAGGRFSRREEPPALVQIMPESKVDPNIAALVEVAKSMAEMLKAQASASRPLTAEDVRRIVNETMASTLTDVAVLKQRNEYNERELASVRQDFQPTIRRVDRLTLMIATKMGITLKDIDQ